MDNILILGSGLSAVGACKLAINQNLSSWKDPIHEGDELAIFPPITGG